MRRPPNYGLSDGPPQVHLPNFRAAISMGISHSLFGSRWITNLHPISYHNSKPSSQKTNPNPFLSLCLSCLSPSACDAEAAALTRMCAFCSLCSLQLWMDEEILFDRSGKICIWRLFFGDIRCPGVQEKKTFSLSIDFLGWREPLCSYYKHAKRRPILCCVSTRRVLFHD